MLDESITARLDGDVWPGCVGCEADESGAGWAAAASTTAQPALQSPLSPAPATTTSRTAPGHKSAMGIGLLCYALFRTKLIICIAR